VQIRQARQIVILIQHYLIHHVVISTFQLLSLLFLAVRSEQNLVTVVLESLFVGWFQGTGQL
jgi:hypothetical protein